MQQASATLQSVTTPDGVRLSYLSKGSGRPYVFSRAWITNLDYYDDEPPLAAFFRALAQRFNLVQFDTRGNGTSDRTPEHRDFESLVVDLETVIDETTEGPIVLHGSAFGGPVAIRYAASHPERVSHLILDNTSPGGPELIDQAQREAFLGMLGMFRTQPDAVFAALGFLSGPSTDTATRTRVERAKNSIDPSVAIDLYSMAFELDVVDLLPEIECPTLIVHSTHNPSFVFRGAELMAERIPDATLVPLEGVAANLWDENTVLALNAIGEFLDEGAFGNTLVEDVGSVATATIMFTDIVGSTQLTRRLGDVASRRLFNVHDMIVRRAVTANSGRIVKNTGDGFLATFEIPRMAVAAAREIRQSLETHQEATQGPTLAVRIGIHRGQLLDEGDDVFGSDVALTQRVMDTCSSSEILVTAGVHDELRLGGEGRRVSVKGFDEEVTVYAI